MNIRYFFMKTFLSLSLTIFFTFTLIAQSDSTETDCINFDEYKLCYAFNYRPRDEKVGTICNIKDLMLNPNVNIESYDIFITYEGNLLPKIKNKGSIVEAINPMLKYLKADKYILITISNIVINNNGTILEYPSISLSNCK